MLTSSHTTCQLQKMIIMFFSNTSVLQELLLENCWLILSSMSLNLCSIFFSLYLTVLHFGKEALIYLMICPPVVSLFNFPLLFTFKYNFNHFEKLNLIIFIHYPAYSFFPCFPFTTLWSQYHIVPTAQIFPGFCIVLKVAMCCLAFSLLSSAILYVVWHKFRVLVLCW